MTADAAENMLRQPLPSAKRVPAPEGELVALSLGSNQGDSVSILRGALQRLSAFLSGMRVSSLYRTAPQDVTDQPDFYNAAVSGRFCRTPDALLRLVNGIEADFGRDRLHGVPKGPRTLDIDILLFGNRTVSCKAPDLEIPHPAMKKRQFVLVPLLEILPDAADPVTGMFFRDVLAGLPDQGVRKSEEELWKPIRL